MPPSFQDPPGHVRPYAYDRRFTGYWIKLVLALYAAGFLPALGYATYSPEYSVIGTSLFAAAGAVSMFLAVMTGLCSISRQPAFVPRNVFRLARTPVGWALLREGANLARNRRRVEAVARNIDGLNPELARRLFQGDGKTVLENAKTTIDDIVAKEADLFSRQRRLLAGETVDEYDKNLASAP